MEETQKKYHTIGREMLIAYLRKTAVYTPQNAEEILRDLRSSRESSGEARFTGCFRICAARGSSAGSAPPMRKKDMFTSMSARTPGAKGICIFNAFTAEKSSICVARVTGNSPQ